MDDAAFDDLDPAGQYTAATAELDALSAKLRRMLARLRAIRVDVADPDGQIRVTLGDDGRLLALFIADDAPRTLTHLELEHIINDLIRDGNDEIADMHADITDTADTRI